MPSTYTVLILLKNSKKFFFNMVHFICILVNTNNKQQFKCSLIFSILFSRRDRYELLLNTYS